MGNKIKHVDYHIGVEFNKMPIYVKYYTASNSFVFEVIGVKSHTDVYRYIISQFKESRLFTEIKEIVKAKETIK